MVTHVEITRALKSYKTDEKLSLTARAAHLLDWAAKHVPTKYVPFNLLYKHSMGQAQTPQNGNKDVLALRRRSQTIRQALEREYNRELLVQSGMGMRATVDSEDVVKNKLPQRTSRFLAAKAALTKTVERVDIKELPRRTAEDKAWSDWAADVAQTMNQLGNGKLDTKLLPPGEVQK